MTIFKPKNYNAIKNEMNIGDVTVMQDVKNGFVGKVVERYVDTTVTPNVTYNRAFVPLTPADLTGENIWVASFTPLSQDYTEVKNPDLTYSSDYIKRKGEFVRLIHLPRLQMAEFEFTANIVAGSYDSVSPGDVLIPAADGSMLWKVGTAAVSAGFEILRKGNLDASSAIANPVNAGSFLAKVVRQ